MDDLQAILSHMDKNFERIHDRLDIIQGEHVNHRTGCFERFTKLEHFTERHDAKCLEKKNNDPWPIINKSFWVLATGAVVAFIWNLIEHIKGIK
jgi:hypothetical protein